MTIRRISAVFIIAVCLAASVAAVHAEKDSSSEMLIGMADPSAVWAEENGYQFIIGTDAEGNQYGITILADGSEHDSWDLFRHLESPVQEGPMIGMADPSAVWAEENGYQFIIETDTEGNQYGIAILPDGSEHDSWDLFRGRRPLPVQHGMLIR